MGKVTGKEVFTVITKYSFEYSQVKDCNFT